MDALLHGGKLPEYGDLARYVAHAATGATLEKMDPGKDWFFGEIGDTRLHMIYKPDRKFLRGEDSALTRTLAERVGAAAKKRKRKAIVFAPWKFVSRRDLSDAGVVFSQLPNALHNLYGARPDDS